VLVTLSDVPVWAVALTAGIALVLLGFTLRHIATPEHRRGIPRTWRVAAWIIVLVSLTISIMALGKHGTIFLDYQATWGEIR
jgi:hypothetical protein